MHANLMREIGWRVEGSLGSEIFYRPLGPVSVAKLQRPQAIDLDWLAHFRNSHHTLTTYIEPGLSTILPDQKLGFKVEPFAHSATSLVDLHPLESKLLASFSQKTRYNIVRTLKKNDLHVTTTTLGNLTNSQLNQFFALHNSWSRQKHVLGYSVTHLQAVLKCFAHHGDLHLAYQDNILVGSLLILYHDSVSTYWAAFATNEGYNLYAPTLLTWVAMQRAKECGCDIFDFGGIYDPRYPQIYKRWQGFTKFKEGFRPTVVAYPPTYLKLFW